MYNKHSLKATEFIDDEEIKETLCFAQENKHNKELISSLIERAADCKGLTHRELRCYWNVIFLRKMKRCLRWQNRSSRSCMAIALLCCSAVSFQLLC